MSGTLFSPILLLQVWLNYFGQFIFWWAQVEYCFKFNQDWLQISDGIKSDFGGI